jgi:hypothetical protein
LGVNNNNPQFTLDVFGSANVSANENVSGALTVGGGIINAGSYINPPLILTGGVSGNVGGYSYVVSSGIAANTGYFPNIATTVGQEICMTNKGGTLQVTGISPGNQFFNTGIITNGFNVISGTTRFFFNDGTHWNVQ